ncbi:MAG: Gfo/Idh/MocA family oxidoreductase [Clostridia bacterium]|nr:Gfo/Idh/MocA family oxidoreductase [Clostridia bacterium]
MKKIRIAIVGYGRSGRNIHTKALKNLTDLFTVVAYADADAQRRQMIKDEMGIDAYTDWTGFIGRDDIDLVVNSSFSHHHADISKKLMEAGFNVLSEKPAAKNAEEFDSILEVMKKTGKKYFVFQQYRFSPAFMKLREIVESGILGRTVQISMNYDGFSRRWDWQTVHDWTAGSLLNTAPHPTDHCLTLMGYPEDVRVNCFMDTARTFGDGEDYVKMILSAPGKPVADIQVSSCNAYAPKTFLVQGTRGTIYGDTKRLDWKYYTDAENPPKELTTVPLRDENGVPIYCREQLVTHEEFWENPVNDGEVKSQNYYRALYETLVNGADFEVKLEQIRLQRRVMGEAHAQNAGLFK